MQPNPVDLPVETISVTEELSQDLKVVVRDNQALWRQVTFRGSVAERSKALD